jgi:hypothetical protein
MRRLTNAALGETRWSVFLLGAAYLLQPRRDVHSIAHEIAVGLLDDVGQMDANANLDALVGQEAGVALGNPRNVPPSSR